VTHIMFLKMTNNYVIIIVISYNHLYDYSLVNDND